MSNVKIYIYKQGSFMNVKEHSIVKFTYRTWLWEDSSLQPKDKNDKLWSYFLTNIINNSQSPIEERMAEIRIGDGLVHPCIERALINQKVGNALLLYIPSDEAFGDCGLFDDDGNELIPAQKDLLIEIKIISINMEDNKMKLSNIILGTFPFAGVFNKIELEEQKNILKKFIENGGKYIHSSLAYAKGNTEKELGKMISELVDKKEINRNDIKIVSCCGWHVNEDGSCIRSGKKEDVLNCFNIACNNFKTTYIDIFMSHLPDPSTNYRETIDTMAHLKSEGKIGAICVSNVTLEQLKEYNYNNDVDYIQQRYSYINQSISSEMFEYCKDHNIKIMAYQVLERGLLTNKVLDNFEIKDTDLRSKKPEFQTIPRNEISNFVKEKINPIAEEKSCLVQELILAWTLRKVEYPLIGISKTKYLPQYCNATSINISDEELKQLDKEYKNFAERVMSNYHVTLKEFIGPDF